MTIRLEINADTPEELIATINGLATLGNGRHTAPAPAVEQTDEEPETERPQAEAPKTRRRKSESTGTAEAVDGKSGAISDAGARDAATSSGAETTVASASSKDQFSEQIKQANAEAAAERAAEKSGEAVSLDVVSQVFAQATAQGSGKMSMMQAQALLKDNFVDVAGEPVRRIRDLQPKDYAAAIAKLEG